MNKLFIAFGLASTLAIFGCSKEVEAEKEAASNTSTTAEAPAEVSSDIPQFSSPEIQKFAKEYAVFQKEIMDAAKSGDAAKIQELQGKATEWIGKAQEVEQQMTPEDAQKWANWTQKLVEESMQNMPMPQASQ